MEDIKSIELDIEKRRHCTNPFGEKYLNVALLSFGGEESVRSALTNLSVRSEIISQMQRKLLKNVECASKKLESNMKMMSRISKKKRDESLSDEVNDSRDFEFRESNCFEIYQELENDNFQFLSGDFFDLKQKRPNPMKNVQTKRYGKDLFSKKENFFILETPPVKSKEFTQRSINNNKAKDSLEESNKKTTFSVGTSFVGLLTRLLPGLNDEEFLEILKSEATVEASQDENDPDEMIDEDEEEEEEEDDDEEEEVPHFEQFGDGDEIGFGSESETTDSEDEDGNRKPGMLSIVREMEKVKKLTIQQKREAVSLRDLKSSNNIGLDESDDESDDEDDDDDGKKGVEEKEGVEEEEDEDEEDGKFSDSRKKKKKKSKIPSFDPQLFNINTKIDFWEITSNEESKKKKKNKNKSKSKKRKRMGKHRKLNLKNRVEDTLLLNNRKRNRKKKMMTGVRLSFNQKGRGGEEGSEIWKRYNESLEKMKPSSINFFVSLCWGNRFDLSVVKRRLEESFGGSRGGIGSHGTIYETVKMSDSEEEEEEDDDDDDEEEEEEEKERRSDDEGGIGGGGDDNVPDERMSRDKIDDSSKPKMRDEDSDDGEEEEEEEEDVIVEEKKVEGKNEIQEGRKKDPILEQRKKRRKMMDTFFQNTASRSRSKFSISRISRIVKKKIKKVKVYDYERDLEEKIHQKKGIDKKRIFMGLLHTVCGLNSGKGDFFVDLSNGDESILINAFRK